MQTLPFVFVEKHGCWSREWKPAIAFPKVIAGNESIKLPEILKTFKSVRAQCEHFKRKPRPTDHLYHFKNMITFYNVFTNSSPFKVYCFESLFNYDFIVCFLRKSGEIRSIYHFHFTDWAERSIPLNGVGLLDMMKCITRVQQQTGNGPIIIHCRYHVIKLRKKVKAHAVVCAAEHFLSKAIAKLKLGGWFGLVVMQKMENVG